MSNVVNGWLTCDIIDQGFDTLASVNCEVSLRVGRVLMEHQTTTSTVDMGRGRQLTLLIPIFGTLSATMSIIRTLYRQTPLNFSKDY